jgi:hypothetical protein
MTETYICTPSQRVSKAYAAHSKKLANSRQCLRQHIPKGSEEPDGAFGNIWGGREPLESADATAGVCAVTDSETWSQGC